MMTNTFYIKLYLLTVPVFFGIDMIWLAGVAPEFYQEQIGHLIVDADDVNWIAALVFYLLYIIGILWFAVLPGLKAGSLLLSARQAALFGFFTYVTYELTNMATLPNWPLMVVVIDTLWGMVLCTSVAMVSYFIGRRLLNHQML